MPRYPRSYLITQNNWTEEQLCACLELLDTCSYSIIGFEKGHKRGTPHFHAYGYWPNGKAINSIKKIIPTAHIDVCRGTPEDNRKYCMKEGEYEEFGICPKQGRRSDIEEFKDDILSGMSEEDLLNKHTEYMAKFDRFYQRCRNITLKEETKKMIAPEVIVLLGEPGCGKTHTVYAENNIEDIYKVEVGDGSSGSIFWDNYNGEPVILIDDFHNNFKLDYMLRLLDKYPMKLNIKGGHTWKCAKKIYITSNIPIENWYPNCPLIHRKALQRRITMVKDLSDQRNEHNILDVLKDV